jgi:hypothetical protein
MDDTDAPSGVPDPKAPALIRPCATDANIFSAAAMLALQYKGHAPESLE